MICFFRKVKNLFTCPQSEQDFREEVEKRVKKSLESRAEDSCQDI